LDIKLDINNITGMHYWWHDQTQAYLSMTLPRLFQTYMVNTKQYMKSSSLLKGSSMSKSFLHHRDVILLLQVSSKSNRLD